ncbi:MAG TPA: folylpolyglutamate synthase/dihydrofolate synthase family protein [Verrucomicrobiae bacterium]|nr:folylpolyglutamate synthase/dihydrofolate synthase family protein [Verrucomicrobiae bacterium]
MNYDESVGALLALGRELASPRQAHVQKFALDNITTLSRALGNPHLAIPCAHVAGTNGKGSTAAFLDSILRASGMRTGLYTSPHLERINERIRFSGEDISDEAFAASWTKIQSVIESLLARGELAAHPTFFECVTAIAFVAFAGRPVDFAVYEVGLGGRLDATNIVVPEVGVIAPVDFDHETFLGHSIGEIAGEKAGIIKAGGWIVSARQREEARRVISRRAGEMGARVWNVDEGWLVESVESQDGQYRAAATYRTTGAKLCIAPSLAGRFQVDNALAAATAALLLRERGHRISEADIEQGISSARWPGRLERLAEHPAVYLDGAHNPSAARELRKFWDDHFAGRRIFLIYGAMRDKAVDEIAGELFPRAEMVFLTQPRQSRSISAGLLAEMTAGLAREAEVAPDPAAALDRALAEASADDAIFATGSLFLVGDLRHEWNLRRAPTAAVTVTPPLPKDLR